MDVTDPVNYAQYWLNPAKAAPPNTSLSPRVHDAATPAITTHALAAARVPSLSLWSRRATHTSWGPANIAMPVYENMMNEQGQMRTAGLKQWDSDHFAPFTETEARTMWQTGLKRYLLASRLS